MNSKNFLQRSDRFAFPYYNIRNISSPEDKGSDRTVYIGYAPLTSIVELPIDDNVRDYIVNAGKRSRKSQVHKAIESTLRNRPDEFGILNGGITIVARACTVDDKKRVVELASPSIIDGAQTQGEVKEFIENAMKSGQLSLLEKVEMPHVKFEVIVTNDDALIAEISIARNFQNDVRPISIVGARGHLDELESAFRSVYPNLRLRKSETDMSFDDNNVVDTEKLLQVIAALVPDELWVKQGEPSKVYTYNLRAVCLRDFEHIVEVIKNSDHIGYDTYQNLYQFYLDIAPQAYDLLQKWKTHQGFIGTRIRSITRDENGRVKEVPNGIIFPILASLSIFAIQRNGRWEISVPANVDVDAELIQQASSAYKNIADSNPNIMGKSKACYATLLQITTLLQKLSPNVAR